MFCIWCLFATILYVVFLFSIFLMKPEKHGINIKYTHQRKLFVCVWKTAKQCLPEISLSHILKLKWALKRKIQNNLANGWLCLLLTKVKSVNNVDNKNQGNRKQYLNIYQSNIVSFWKDLSWPDFNDEPRVQEKQEVRDQQSCIFVFVPCLTIPGSN